MEFKDKVILITGAASGIGKATALAFAQEGGIIAVSDIDENEGLQTVEELKKNGAQATFIKTNVANHIEVKALVDQVVSEFGRIDIAVNNAGIAGHIAKTVDSDIDHWEQVMAVNASSVFYGMKYEIPYMLKQGGGVIVNTASIAGLRALPNSLPYVASKHAVVGMTKTAAVEYARNNIRINAICPVFTVTNLFDPVKMDQFSEGLSEKLKRGIPMKRFASVDEMANAILFLCSDRASFITGHALPVDGGLTA